MRNQYEPRIGLRNNGDGILEPSYIKCQDSTFVLGFKPTKKDFQAMIAQKREKRRVEAARQISESLLKILHLSEIFLAPFYTYQPQLSEQEGEGPNRAFTNISNQQTISVSIADLRKEVSDHSQACKTKSLSQRKTRLLILLTLQLSITLLLGGGSRFQSWSVSLLPNQSKPFFVMLFCYSFVPLPLHCFLL